MATDISTTLPQIDLGNGYFLVVDTQDLGAIVTKLAVSGTYSPPAGEPEPGAEPLFVPLPAGESEG